MTLLTYIKGLTADDLASFASMAETSVGYLHQVAYGYKKVGPEFALRLEIASAGALNARDLCPEFPWDTAAKILCAECVAEMS